MQQRGTRSRIIVVPRRRRACRRPQPPCVSRASLRAPSSCARAPSSVPEEAMAEAECLLAVWCLYPTQSAQSRLAHLSDELDEASGSRERPQRGDNQRQVVVPTPDVLHLHAGRHTHTLVHAQVSVHCCTNPRQPESESE